MASDIFYGIEGRMVKKARLERIKEIIETEEIVTQKELAKRLSKVGFKVTQATLSRDLKGLNVVKMRGREGRLVYSLGGRDDQTDNTTREARRMIQSFVTDINVSENLIVIKTMPGHAQGVAASLDGLRLSGTLGTVAGDDTILVVTDGSVSGKKIADDLNKTWTGRNKRGSHGG